MNGRKLASDSVSVGGSGFEADLALKNPCGQEVQRVVNVPCEFTAGGLEPSPRHWHVDVGPDGLKTRRHYSDDGSRLPIQHNRGAEDSLVAVKFAVPKSVIEQRDKRRSGLQVLLAKPTPNQRRHTPEFHGIGCCADTVQHFTDVSPRVHERWKEPVGKDVFERVVAVSEGGNLVEVIHPTAASVAIFEILNRNSREPLRAAIREWIEHAVVHHAENNGGGADAQCEGQDRHGGEARVLAELPHCKAQILKQATHFGHLYSQRKACHPRFRILLIPQPPPWGRPSLRGVRARSRQGGHAPDDAHRKDHLRALPTLEEIAQARGAR